MGEGGDYESHLRRDFIDLMTTDDVSVIRVSCVFMGSIIESNLRKHPGSFRKETSALLCPGLLIFGVYLLK